MIYTLASQMPFVQYQEQASDPIWQSNGFWFVMGMLTIVVIGPILMAWVKKQIKSMQQEP